VAVVAQPAQARRVEVVEHDQPACQPGHRPHRDVMTLGVERGQARDL